MGVNVDQVAEALYRVELRNKTFDLVKILNKVMVRCSWEWNDIGGSGRCLVNLSIDPKDINTLVGPDYEVRIHIKENPSASEILFYRGFMQGFKPSTNVPNSGVQLVLDGYSAKLKRARVNRTYINTEISIIVKDILDQDVLPITSITYDSADIQNTGFIIDEIVFDQDAASALRTLATTAGDFTWGVDRFLKVFFKDHSSVIEHTVRQRRGIRSENEFDDYGGIINRLVIKGAGSFEDTVNNTESQDRFGIRSKTITNSAISTTALSQKYGSSLLADLARIQRKVNVRKVQVTKLYETTTPVKRMAIVREPIATAQLYGTPLYGEATLYGGLASFIMSKIKYSLLNTGAFNADFNLGQARPDIALEIKKLESEIENVRNQ